MRIGAALRGSGGIAALLSIQLLGCSKLADQQVTANGRLPAVATVGAHAIAHQRMHAGHSSLSIRKLQPRGGSGVMVIGIGRGDIQAFEPPVEAISGRHALQVGELHRYTKYPNSGTALYSLSTAGPAADMLISARTPPDDEITMATVEVLRSKVQDFQWNEAFPGKFFGRYSVKSKHVTTTGPATLVAFWWGDAGVRGEKRAVPEDSFQLLDSVLAPGELVQCAVAVKEVSTAGKYAVTWTTMPRQGAQLWLVALQ